MLETILLFGFIGGVIILGSIYLIKNLFKPFNIEGIKALIEAGKYQQVITQLSGLMQKDSDNPLARLYLAEAYFYNNNNDLALVEFRQLLNSGKFNKTTTEKQIRRRLVELYLKINQPEEAQKELLILCKLDPENTDYLVQIGELFYQRGMKEQALAYVQKALKSGKGGPAIHLLAGKIYFEINQMSEALNSFTNCIKNDLKNPEAHYYSGLILRNMGSTSKAVQEFDLAETAKDKSLKIKAMYQKGLCQLEAGNIDVAKSSFERALKNSPEENNTTIAARYSLAATLEQERKLGEAIEHWEAISRLKPNYLDVQSKLAEYEDLRMDDHMKELITAAPNNFEAISKKLLKTLGYEMLEVTIINNDNIEAVGVESTQKWRDMSGGKVLIKITRENEEVNEEKVSQLVGKLKSSHGVRAVYISTAKFSPGAVRYSESRPVDLYDRQKLSSVFKTPEKTK